jgi:hypothetical protein
MLLPSHLIISPTARYLVLLFSIFWTLVSIVSAVPQVGILRDAANKFPRDSFMSYSGVIEFEDKSIPSDKDKMSDAQFINFAKVAYDEMVAIWQGLKFREDACPGAMMALESEGFIYFASSIRCPNEVEFNSIDQDIKNSVGWWLKTCKEQGMGTHRNGGRCAEPNMLRLYGDVKGLTSDNPPIYKSPPTTATSPRVAVWARPKGTSPNQNKELYLFPCLDDNAGYGCIRMKGWYGLKPVSRQKPDPAGQDDWKFKISTNPRRLWCKDQ